MVFTCLPSFLRIFSPSVCVGNSGVREAERFFDSIRSERDDLRDEVVVLKEQLKVCKRNKKNLNSTADLFLQYVFAENLNLAQ